MAREGGVERPAEPPVEHVGFNVYCWGQTSQNRLLVECLTPAVHDLGRRLDPLRFWFDRIDTRGPHVTALLTGPPGSGETIAGEVAAQLAEFLSTYRQRTEVGLAEAEKRHLSCRGWALSEVDREPGLAEEGSFRCFAHDAAGYPFRLTRGLREEVADGAWRLVHDLSLWTVGELSRAPERPAVRAALRWAAAFAVLLDRMHPEPERYWRFHASTLLFNLPDRLAEDEPQVLGALSSAIGERNERLFSSFWEEARDGDLPWPLLPRLFDCVLPVSGSPVDESWRLTREIVHWTLKQLCFYVASEIPLVLYAWRQSLRSPAPVIGAPA